MLKSLEVRVTFGNFKHFSLSCVFGKARRVCGELVWSVKTASKAAEISRQETYHKGLLYLVTEVCLHSSGT